MRPVTERSLAAVFAVGFAVLAAAPGAAAGDGLDVRFAEALDWQPYLGVPGVEMARLHGDPRQPGPYTVRARFAPGAFTRPHFHGETRTITVLAGTWWGGHGARFAPADTVALPPGTFVVHGAGRIHYDGAKDETVVVQISDIGPTSTTFVDPATTEPSK